MDGRTIIKLLRIVHDELVYGSQTETEIAEHIWQDIKKLKKYYGLTDKEKNDMI